MLFMNESVTVDFRMHPLSGSGSGFFACRDAALVMVICLAQRFLNLAVFKRFLADLSVHCKVQ